MIKTFYNFVIKPQSKAMKNKVKILREEKNMTQNELAEKSGLSLRTIQRIEAGNMLKGFTLKTIAKTLEIDPEKLFDKTDFFDIERAKIINFSVAFGFIIPFGNIVVPLILTNKTKDIKTKEIGKQIVAVQIILSFILSILLIVSPFLQKAFSLSFPLFLVPLIGSLILKLIIVLANGISLNQKQELAIKLKNNFL